MVVTNLKTRTVRKVACLKTERHYWMDLLNVIACFAVIVLHCTTSVFLNSGDFKWCVDAVLQSIFIFAVPVFFMISGANLLGYRKKYSTKDFFIKRFRRVVFALVVASIIVYIGAPLISKAILGSPVNLSIGDFLRSFFHNEICDVYWFFYAIIGLYLITPVFSLLAENRKTLQYSIAICITTSMLIPLIERFLPDHSLLDLFMYPYLSSWLTYYLLGYYLVHFQKKTLNTRLLFLACLASVFIMAAMTIKTNIGHSVASEAFAPYDGFYANASSLFALIYSSALILLFKKTNISVKNAPIYPLIRKVSALSLGIYAIHMLIINSFDLFVPHSFVWDIVIRPFVVFAISMLLAYIGTLLMKLFRKATAQIKSTSPKSKEK